MLGSTLRAKAAVAAATIVALTAGSGIAWAFWRVTGSGSATAAAGSAVALRADGRPHPNAPLYPGARADMLVTVHNDNRFPVLVTLLRPGTGGITVDSAHRDAGCGRSGVSLTSTFYNVSWEVPAGSSATYLLPAAVRMTNDSDSACQGATFGVPVTLTGRSNAR